MKLKKEKKRYFGEHTYSAKKLIREFSTHPDILAAVEKFPPEKSWNAFSSDPVTEALKEIVATPSRIIIDGFAKSLKPLWYRIFNGLEIQGLSELKEQTKGKRVIYMPSHRSHLDYLLLSYVLLENYLEAPHIIAGNNLNMIGVGKILKSSGAVFIRRAFTNQPIYATAFITYIHYLLDHRVPLEVFIEGGRSRTGKNMPPKIGFLSILIEYFLKNPDKDLSFVPVSFTYERIPEESAYVNELNGGEKQQENMFELLKAYKVLKKNFGKVYVSFAPVMSLRQMIDIYAEKNGFERDPEPDTPEFKEMAYSFGMDVLEQINIHTRISALPIVVTALLSEKHRGFLKSNLLQKSQFLVDVYQAVHPRAQDTLVESEGGLEGVIDFLIQSGTVHCIKEPDEDIYYFNSNDKIRLNLYKNIFVHHFVIPSIIAMKILHGVKTREALLEHIQFFDNLLRYEFMFPKSYDFIEATDTMLKFSVDRELITEQKGEFWVNLQNGEQLEMLANIILPFLEAFHTAIKTLTSNKVSFPLNSNKLITTFRESHQKNLLLGEISSIEGNLTVTYKNIIRFFLEEKFLNSKKTTQKRTVITKGQEFENIERLDRKLFYKYLVGA